MHKYKLLALDLDDTLLDSGGKIPEASKRAIKLARQIGVKVIFATGRMFASALPFARELEIEDYLITYEGALVKHTITNQVLQHLPVPLDLAIATLDMMEIYDCHINVYLDDIPYIARKTKESEIYMAISKIPMVEVGNLANFLRQRKEEPTKIVVVAPEAMNDQLLSQFRAVFGKKMHIAKSKPNFLEISHPLGNKGDALAVMAKHYNLTREEIIAVGDSYNDLEMINYAGLGVVVENARLEIKARADYVCSSNDECGVAEVVARFIL